MDLRESFRTLRRRWLLTSLMFLLALAAAAAAVVELPWTYISKSTVVLLASPHASKAVTGNPFLAFDTSLTLTADVVRRELMDPRTVQDLAGRGYAVSYAVVDAPDTTGPVLLLTVTGSNKAAAEHTLHGVTSEVSTKLNELQSSVAPGNRIGDLVLAMSPEASLSKSKKARPVAVILALGLALTFVVPQVVEGRAARRKRQRDVTSEPAARRFPDQESVGQRSAVPRDRAAASSAEQPRRVERLAEFGEDFEPDDAAPAARWRSR